MVFECAFNETYTPIVKNTFIDFPKDFEATPALQRCNSSPASLCGSPKDGPQILEGKLLLAGVPSDTSTDAQTEASTCSECGGNTSADLDNCYLDEALSQGSAVPYSSWKEVSAVTQTAPFPGLPAESQRLNSQASAFQPKSETVDPAKQQWNHRFEEIITWTKESLQQSGEIAQVEVWDETDGWVIMVKPQVMEACSLQTERLLTLAKEALLDASAMSRCVYVMGYNGPKPFTQKPQGFEATLGVMENARSACFHVFKKGFCRHGAECSKNHPACEQTVQVVVESASMNSCTRFVKAFQQEVAALVMMVTATLGSCTYAEEVQAFDNKEGHGWTIEVTPKEEMKQQKEYLESIAQNALFRGTSDSNMVYILGYATKPFFSKSNGFVTIVGDMQEEDKACWDFYSKGFCTRACSCRWEHPECLMPINVVIKERSSLKCTPAMLEYLAGNGLLSTPSQ